MSLWDFFLHKHIYMHGKYIYIYIYILPTRIKALKNHKCHLKKIMHSGNSKTVKLENQINQKNTVIGWLPNKEYFYTGFHF